MIIVNIIGGLGNQMFQYALGKSIALKTKQPLKLDITAFKAYELRSYELAAFNISCSIAAEEEINALKYKNPNFFEKLNMLLRKQSAPYSEFCYKEKYYHFDSEVLDNNESIYLFGYWQSEKYFLDCKETILKEFTLKREISLLSTHYLNMITSSASVSLHIRRGDYVNNRTTNDYHGTCNLDYYKKAVSIIKIKNFKTHFFIFSDDLDWAKKNIDFIDNITFVELSADIPDYEEMYLMSMCRHNIIANSSFSWWGAWLNQNHKKIVIAPKLWFNDGSINTNDLIPNTWIRI